MDIFLTLTKDQSKISESTEWCAIYNAFSDVILLTTPKNKSAGFFLEHLIGRSTGFFSGAKKEFRLYVEQLPGLTNV